MEMKSFGISDGEDRIVDLIKPIVVDLCEGFVVEHYMGRVIFYSI